MTKATSLIAAIEAEAPAQADSMRHALIGRRDARREESPDIEDQLTGGDVARLQARMQQEAGRKVRRVVARGQKAARAVVEDIIAAKNEVADNEAAAAEKMAAYNADRTREIAHRQSGERTDWSPAGNGYTSRKDRKDTRAENGAQTRATAVEKVRAERDKPVVKPCIARGGR